MQATLTFTLPDDEDNLQTAIDAEGWRRVAEEMERSLRNWIKYGNEFKNADEALAAARGALWEFIKDGGLEI